MGVRGELLEWFQQWFTERKQSVSINGEKLKWIPVTSGVSQGKYCAVFTSRTIPTKYFCLIKNSQACLRGNFTTSTTSYKLNSSGKSYRNEEEEAEKPIHLMSFPWLIWPNLWFSIRNWFFANIIIRPYMDNDFNVTSFKRGAKQALIAISQNLSKGNFDALVGLITVPCLQEVKTNFVKLSFTQQLELSIALEDIFFSFPYQIGIFYENEGQVGERVFVEITMVCHVFRDFCQYIEETAATLSGPRHIYNNIDRISIVNYRFIREYTKGIEDSWTVNLLNHFKPGEHLKQ